MSKGSPIIPIRIPPGLLEDLECVLEERNANARAAPWSRSEFILAAIREKIAKTFRSRRNYRRRPADQAGGDQAGGDQVAGELQE